MASPTASVTSASAPTTSAAELTAAESAPTATESAPRTWTPTFTTPTAVSDLIERIQKFFSELGDKFDPEVRTHLSQVYMVLGMALASTGFGVLLQLCTVDLGLLAALASLALVLGLHFYRDDGKNYNIRLGMLVSFGFCSGQTIGPMMQFIIGINPSIIVTALAGTAAVFISLSFAALYAEPGKFLFLGSLLVSILNTMAIVSLFNMFFQSFALQLAHLYIGVAVMAAYVVYDTQNIVDKCLSGNRDVVQHALDLFFDILSMYRRLLIILTQKLKNELLS